MAVMMYQNLDELPPESDRATRTNQVLALSAAVLLGVGTVVFQLLEDDWGWIDSFYFSAVTVTTVGFGDLTPTTDVAKLFTVLYIFAGISIITAYLNARTGRRISRNASRLANRRADRRDDQRDDRD